MVRPPRFINGINTGLWSRAEDQKLRNFVLQHGLVNWQKLPHLAGLTRSGKSCRLRWMNYLQPGLKKSNFSKQEVDLIIRLHNRLGNKWSAISNRLPGRTDNDIKNYWHAHIKNRVRHNGVDSKEVLSTSGVRCSETTPAVSVSSDNGSNTGVSEFLGEGFPDPGVCHYGTPSECELNNIPLISEEELSTSGSYTPAFCDTSDDRMSYDDPTLILSQVDLDELSSLLEEVFPDLGVGSNDAPTSSDGGNGVSCSDRYEGGVCHGMSRLERAWYFGEDY